MNPPTASTSAPADLASVPSGLLECERCGRAFHCGARDAQPCACMGLGLNDAQRREMGARYRHCLCVACLAQIAAGAPVVR